MQTIGPADNEHGFEALRIIIRIKTLVFNDISNQFVE